MEIKVFPTKTEMAAAAGRQAADALRRALHARGKAHVIAATGYRPGLQAVLGPSGLLDDRGLPTIGSRGAVGVAPGLFTVGITIVLSGLLREIGKDVKRLVHSIARPN